MAIRLQSQWISTYERGEKGVQMKNIFPSRSRPLQCAIYKVSIEISIKKKKKNMDNF